jgi:hypothetical protein
MVFWAWSEMREISMCLGGSEPLGYRWTSVSGKCDLASNPRGVSCGMEMGSARSRPLRTDHQTNNAFLDPYRTNRPPCYGRGCGVRLVVDSTPPIGGSVWSFRETALSSLEDFAPARPGKGSTASRDLSRAVWALPRRLSQARRRRRVLSTYLAFSRMVGSGTGDGRFRSYSGG